MGGTGTPLWQSGSNLGTGCLSFCSALLHVHKLIVTDVHSTARARFLYRFLRRKLLPALCVPPSSILYDLYWMFVHRSCPARLPPEEGSRDPCDPPKPSLAVTFGESPVFQGAKDFFRCLLELERVLDGRSTNTKAQYYCGICVGQVCACFSCLCFCIGWATRVGEKLFLVMWTFALLLCDEPYASCEPCALLTIFPTTDHQSLNTTFCISSPSVLRSSTRVIVDVSFAPHVKCFFRAGRGGLSLRFDEIDCQFGFIFYSSVSLKIKCFSPQYVVNIKRWFPCVVLVVVLRV